MSIEDDHNKRPKMWLATSISVSLSTLTLIVLVVGIGIGQIHQHAITWRPNEPQSSKPNIWLHSLNVPTEARRELKDLAQLVVAETKETNTSAAEGAADAENKIGPRPRRNALFGGGHYSAGALPSPDIAKYAPHAFEYFHRQSIDEHDEYQYGMAHEISNLLRGEAQLFINSKKTSVVDPALLVLRPIPRPSCCMLLSYTHKGDGVGFHYDANTFGGMLINVIVHVDTSPHSCSYFEFKTRATEKSWTFGSHHYDEQQSNNQNEDVDEMMKQRSPYIQLVDTIVEDANNAKKHHKNSNNDDDENNELTKLNRTVSKIWRVHLPKMANDNEINNDKRMTAIVYQGATLYHRVTPQCKGQHRIVWNAAFVVGQFSPSPWQRVLNSIYDVGYAGISSLFEWSKPPPTPQKLEGSAKN